MQTIRMADVAEEDQGQAAYRGGAGPVSIQDRSLPGKSSSCGGAGEVEKDQAESTGRATRRGRFRSAINPAGNARGWRARLNPKNALINLGLLRTGASVIRGTL
jgi:hypothetical protein